MIWNRNSWWETGMNRGAQWRYSPRTRADYLLSGFLQSMYTMNDKDSLCAYVRGFDKGVAS
jgi:hypothetical protein